MQGLRTIKALRTNTQGLLLVSLAGFCIFLMFELHVALLSCYSNTAHTRVPSKGTGHPLTADGKVTSTQQGHPVRRGHNTAEPTAEDGRTKYVLILTYMRAGSTLTGELFNRNPQAFYWFEPVEPLFTAMYSTKFGQSIPLEIFYDKSGNRRSVPAEEEYIQQQIINSFKCNMDKLDSQSLFHPYVFERSRSFSNYAKCVLNSTKLKVKHIINCQDYASSECGVAFHAASMKRYLECKTCKNIVQNYFKSHNYSYNKSVNWQDIPITDGKVCGKRYGQGLLRQHQCLEKIRHKSGLCILNVTSTCQRSSIRAIKEIRMSMEQVGSLLRKLPQLKLIHLLRDPRGIIASRKASHILPKGLSIHASWLCKKMLHDVITRYALASEFGADRILEIKYENVARSPVKIARQVYKFLNIPEPSNSPVFQYMGKSTRANISDGDYGTMRKQGYKIPYAWKQKLPAYENKLITNACAEFFDIYPDYLNEGH